MRKDFLAIFRKWADEYSVPSHRVLVGGTDSRERRAFICAAQEIRRTINVDIGDMAGELGISSSRLLDVVGNVQPVWRRPVPEDKPDPARPMHSQMVAMLKDMPGITVSDVYGKSRATVLVEARRNIARELKRLNPDASLPIIGKVMRKHHTTVLYYLAGRCDRKSQSEEAAA